MTNTLSPAAYAILDLVARREMTVRELEDIVNVSIRALLRRKLIGRWGKRIVITPEGEKVRQLYKRKEVPKRSYRRPLSPTVEELLLNARTSLIMEIRRKIA